MTSFDSKVLLDSQKLRTHVTMVFAWSEPTGILFYCAMAIITTIVCKLSQVTNRLFPTNLLPLCMHVRIVQLCQEICPDGEYTLGLDMLRSANERYKSKTAMASWPALCINDSNCLRMQGWWLIWPPKCEWKLF